MVFMGLTSSPLAVGTVDRGNIRLDTQTGEVWILEAGDPPPTIGAAGGAMSLTPLLWIVGGAIALGMMGRRR